MSLLPIITICGTTGVGKSKLAVDLATHLCRGAFASTGWSRARVINADAMQVYAGLDTLTNKIPLEERLGIEHQLLGFKHPGERYVVGDWIQDALKLIEESHKRSEIPIIVGGTSYWIQHLIFPNRLVSEISSKTEDDTRSPSDLASNIASLPPELYHLFLNLPDLPPSATTDAEATYRLHRLLSILDAPMAERWHWKDSRKVLRSLTIIKDTGRRPSDIIEDQDVQNKDQQPRFRSLFLWLYSDMSSLHPRLSQRVDQMLQQGLLDEVRALHHLSQNPMAPQPDFTQGIYQSIGYREFHEYISSQHTDTAYADAVERMKISTRQYAKRQVSWIRNKLLPAIYAIDSQPRIVPAYLLDATQPGDAWDVNVHLPALEILKAFLQETEMPDPQRVSGVGRDLLLAKRSNRSPQKVVCSICTIDPTRPIMINEGDEWSRHARSRVHNKLVRKAKKVEE